MEENFMVEYWKKAAVVGGLGAWSDAMDSLLMAHTIGMISATWRLGPEIVGILVGVWGIGSVISAIISGPIIDAFGRKKTWVLANAITGIIYIYLAMAPNEWYFMAGRLLTGIFALMSTLAALYIYEEAPKDRRGFAAGVSGALGLLGALNSSGMLIVASVTGIGWRGIYWYGVAWNFFVAILGLVALKESSLWLERKKLMAEGKISKQRVPFRQLFAPETRRRFVLSALVYVCIATLLGLPINFRSYLELTVLQFPYELTGALGIVMTLVGTVGAFVWPRLSDKIGRVKTLIAISIVGLIGAQLCFRTNILVGVGATLPVIAFYLLFWCVWVFGWNGGTNTERAWSSELFPTSIRGTATSLRTIIGGLFAAFSQMITGFLAAYLGGLMTVYWLLTAIGGIGAILLLWLGRAPETKGIKMEA
jgi:MFS family permease